MNKELLWPFYLVNMPPKQKKSTATIRFFPQHNHVLCLFAITTSRQFEKTLELTIIEESGIISEIH